MYSYRNFQQVLELTVARALEIPQTHCVLFWHHCLMHAYSYLNYTRN